MAKRKRLSPAQNSYLSPSAEAAGTRGPMGLGAAPIAQVASEASSQAALQELSDVLESARNKGLMIQEIPLAEIDATYLVRDRIEQNEDEMQALMASLRARGQQTPIEVMALEEGAGCRRYGLISGWRRLSAMRRLAEEGTYEGAGFQTIKALLINPESAEDAYVAMVEENEIRVNLSHYERARIAVRAMHEHVFPTLKVALQALFANVPRAKRSKIRSFVTLVEALDDVLLYPTAISEKLGLGLAREISETPEFAARLVAALEAADRPNAQAEQEVLQAVLSPEEVMQKQALTRESDPVFVPEPSALRPDPAPDLVLRPSVRDPAPQSAPGERQVLQAAPGVRLGFQPDAQRIELTGEGVTPALMADLKAWLRSRMR